MDPTCGLADKLRDLVLDLIWEQLHYLICYGQNIEQLNEQLVELSLQRRSIQHRIYEARNNVEQIEEQVLHWLDEVDKISEKVEQLHKESQAKRECGITSCPNPWLRYKLSKRAKEMAQEVANIFGKGKFDRVSHPVPPQPMPESTNRESNEGIDSRVPIMNQIMEELRNPSVNMIGLCGLGGVGKTTIAREVEEKGKNQKMFEKVIMVTVSNELDVEKIQCQIAEKLGMQLNEKTEDVRACRLCERLKEEKNMLLILDDLWEELDLRKVGIPFIDVENYGRKKEGCKILLTSRDEKLLSNRMKCQKIIKVGFLTKNEALELFKRIAELSTDSSSAELINIATQIVQKFGGLPLAISTAAKALKGEKDLNVWKHTLKRLTNPLTRNYTGVKEVDTILKWSYDRLSSSEYKNIFLLAAMLSHDPSIEDLLMCSVGLDFLEHIENMEEAYVGISTVVSKLKSLNLFLGSSSSHHFTIHDVFRDVALSVATDELHAFIHRRLKEWPDKNRLEGCKGICLQESDISDLPEELHGPGLEFLMLNSTKHDLTIPSMFFRSSKELKLLAFTNVHFSLLPSLSDLEKLKALCLHSCELKDITEVGSLKKLKVLSLAYSEIERLSVEVAKLTSLQMLNLSHCSKLKVIPQKLLSSLTKLEVLYMGNSFDQWKVEGYSEADENASLEELKDLPISSLDIQIPNVSTLPENLFLKMKLKKYRIFIGKQWKWQGNHETSKILRLELESSIDLTVGFRRLLEGVEDLHLHGSKGLENILHSHEVRGSSCLRHLCIKNNDDIKYIVLNSAHREDAFPILESLELKNLNALENLCEGPNAIVFRQLHTLKMENLRARTGDCSIKDRGTNNASNNIFKSIFNKVLLPKLEILNLYNLKYSIPMIWNEQLSHDSFSNLKTLSVEYCGFVKLVPLHVLKSLNKLEELDVSYCDMLEKVFDSEDLNDTKEMESSSVVVPLKKLKLQRLPKLKNVWSDHYQGNVSFPCLRSIYVSDCKRLTNMFPTSIAKGMLGDLEDIQISNCGIDVIVAKDQVSESATTIFKFPRLISLQLSHLPNLRNFYPQGYALEWPHLQQLSIRYCDALEIFEKEVSNSSEVHEEENTLDSKYPLLTHDKVMGKLKELKLPGKQVEVIGSGQFPMYNFPEVKVLNVDAEESTTILYRSLLKSFPKLEELQLDGDFEEVFGGDDVAVPFSKLTLEDISNMISLSPSFVSSPNLTHLVVTLSSDRLTALMTSSTARSLVHLTHLSITDCFEIEEIITKQNGEDDEDKEIIFSKLEFLELEGLLNLKTFCRHNYTLRFPLLDHLIIKECPRFKTFSPGLIDAPSLKSVQVSQDWWGKHHEIWDTNLNKTVYQQRFVRATEVVLDEDDASMIRNDVFPVDLCCEVGFLCIKRFVEEWVTFPYTLLERFPKLNALHVKDSSFEEIFPSHAHIVDQIPPFKELHLENLDKLKNIWRDDSQLPPIQNLQILHVENYSNLITLAPSSTSFDNLTELKVSKCHQLIYLVTNSTAKNLVNLETLEINDCNKMEEIVRKETDEGVEGGITFNKLKTLKLDNLPRLKILEEESTLISKYPLLSSHVKVSGNLEEFELEGKEVKMIGSGQFPMYHFPKVKLLHLSVQKATTISDISLLKSFPCLEELVLRGDFKEASARHDVSALAVPFSKLTLSDISSTISLSPSFLVSSPNLTHLVVVSSSYGLTTLMTTSAARSLVHLTHLSITRCYQIEEIITMHEGEDDENNEIVFNKLQFLKLKNLSRLKRFCRHNYSFKFPLLEHVAITECPHLTMFCPGTIYAPRLQSVQVDQHESHEDIWKTNLNNTVEHLFTFEEVISTTRSMALNAKNITTITNVFLKVSTLYVESFPDEGVTFPYSSLERFPQLYELYVEHCSFEEIFPSHDQIMDFMGKIPPFRELRFAYLDQLKSIWKDDSQLPSIHQNLRVLEVKSCCNLVKLAPSSASFQNLWKLSVSGCHQLIRLVTTSTAKSLVSLRRLEINDCKKMEEIIMNETNENVKGAITFNQLWRIELTDMPSLKMFSSQTYTFEFPELEEIQITGCPEMKMFCPAVLETPKLSKVKIEERDMEWKDKGQDLSKTIEMLSSAKDNVNI